jgi:hypothetical protein
MATVVFIASAPDTSLDAGSAILHAEGQPIVLFPFRTSFALHSPCQLHMIAILEA